MKNICFITQCSLPIPTTKGGAVETLVEYLINENEIQNKYNITVISIGDEEAEKKTKNYKYTKFVYINKSNSILNKILLFLYKVLKHINIYIPFSLEFKKALKELKKIEAQDCYIYEAGPTTQLPALGKIIEKNKLLVHIHWNGMSNLKKDKCFAYLIPVSDYIGEEWKKNTNRRNDTMKPLYNCAKIELFSKKISQNEKVELKKSLNIPLNNKIIIFTGRIVEEKGVKELLEAYENINSQNVTLLIIGSANFGSKTNTKYEKNIKELISNSKKNIVFTGYIHQTELYKYYNISDIAVMPSLFQEPAGLVSIEAQSTGTPLIATKVGGIPEYVNEKSAILIEKDNNLVENLSANIEWLIENEEKRKEMSIAGIENAKRFNTKNYFNSFCKIIDEIY